MFLASDGDETFSPDYFDPVATNGGALGQRQSVTLTTHISDAPAGELLSFQIFCTRGISPIVAHVSMSCCLLGAGRVLSVPVISFPLGDVNLDSVVDFSDIPPFITVLTVRRLAAKQLDLALDSTGEGNFRRRKCFRIK